MRKLTFLLGLIYMLSLSHLFAQTLYVSTTGSDSNPGTNASPFLTIQKASDMATPGTTVIVKPGIYIVDQDIILGNSGTSSAWVVIKAETPLTAKIIGTNTNAFDVQCAYIQIDGFDITTKNGSGVAARGTGGYHHIKVTNNYIHDCGSAGIGADSGDYYYFENNTIDNCCFLNTYAVSGISIWEPIAFDNAPGFHDIIRNNYISNCHQDLGAKTDGNGIIIDDHRHTQNPGVAYTNYTLVENNVVFGNYGRGIHVYLSDNVTLRNNITYDNGKDPSISVNYDFGTWSSNNVNAVNNIVIHKSGTKPSVQNDGTTGTWTNNIFVGTTGIWGVSTSTNQINVDPLLLDVTKGDFHLTSSSTAINAGTTSVGSPLDDIEGYLRDASIDIGAFEYHGAIQNLHVTSISLPSTANIYVGRTQKFIVSYLPINATYKHVTWTSSNTAIATVATDGTVTGKTAGSCAITAVDADAGKVASIALTVDPAPYEAVPGKVEAELFVLSYGGVQLENTLDIGGGQNVGYVQTGCYMDYQVNVAVAGTYYVDFRVASASDSKHLQLKKGNSTLCDIVVPNTGGWQTWTTVTASVTLTAGQQVLRVNAPTRTGFQWNLNWFEFRSTTGNVSVTGVSVSPTTVSLNSIGATQQLTVTLSPSNATNKNATWSSSNSSVASVNSSGLVTAVNSGTATITATTQDGGFTATSTITVSVSSVAVTGVAVSPTSASINEGATQQLTATVSPSNATNKNVIWSSSNSGVANVNASGLVTGMVAGNAIITVTTQDGGLTSSCTITVTTAPIVSNLALNQPAFVSTIYSSSYLASYAVDGSTTSQWRSLNSDANPWISVDLGATYSINQVQLLWSTLYGKAYLIQISTDNTNWTTIKTVTAENGGTDNHIGLTGDCRYVRIYVTTRSSNNKSVILNEFEVYGVSSLKSAQVATSINNSNSKISAISMFPNPASEYATVRIESNSNENVALDIYNITGQLKASFSVILSNGENSITLDFAKLNITKGMYVIQVQSGNFFSTEKLVVK